jgi:Cell wall-associated hydrolases (invasion-associated proteins)
MKVPYTKGLATVAFAFTLCIGLHYNVESVKADAVVATQEGIVLKSADLKVDKTITVPKKVVTTTSAKATNNTDSSQSLSRGFSGGSTVASGSTSSIVNKAFEFMGAPYVFGASGPRAFDCSGFTAYVYGCFGVSLPHYTVSQSQMGQAVSQANLQPGDLVFFNTAGYISHVGIYIGGGQFIHASSGSHQITVSDLSGSYYATRYVGARRILK